VALRSALQGVLRRSSGCPSACWVITPPDGEQDAARSGPPVGGDALGVTGSRLSIEILLTGELDEHDPVVRPGALRDAGVVVGGQQRAAETGQDRRERLPDPGTAM